MQPTQAVETQECKKDQCIEAAPSCKVGAEVGMLAGREATQAKMKEKDGPITHPYRDLSKDDIIKITIGDKYFVVQVTDKGVLFDAPWISCNIRGEFRRVAVMPNGCLLRVTTNEIGKLVASKASDLNALISKDFSFNLTQDVQKSIDWNEHVLLLYRIKERTVEVQKIERYTS